jgi:hypothetical protein
MKPVQLMFPQSVQFDAARSSNIWDVCDPYCKRFCVSAISLVGFDSFLLQDELVESLTPKSQI